MQLRGMKVDLVVCLVLATAFIGCAPSPTAVPAVPSNSPAPQPAITGPSPSTPTSTSSPPPSTQTALTEPAVLARFNLVPLPGAGRTPTALALLGQTLYVANRDSDNIALIRDRRVRAFIPTARSPSALVADPAQSRIYAATYTTPTISIIADDSIIRTAVLSDSVQSFALAEDTLLVGLGSSATIELRDPTTLEKKGAVKLSHGFDIVLMVIDAPRRRLYANSYGWVTVLDLDTLRELSSFQAPYIFGSLAVEPNDGSIWAGVFDDQQSRGYLIAYDQAGRELKRVPLGADLRGATFDSSGRIFVTNSFLNQVAVVEAASGRVLANINVGVNPTSLVLDDANHTLYAASEYSDNVAIIDTSTLRRVGVIPVGMDVSALLANEERGRVYAANASTDSVFVIEHGQVVDEIAVGHHPVDLARDPKTDRLFVANYADGALSIVDENSLSVQASVPITRSLSTVAVDPVNNYLFADSTMLTLDTLQPEGIYLARGVTLGSRSRAEFVRVNPAQKKIYVFAYNGIPGSNARTIPFTFLETDLGASKTLPYRNGGNITALALDPSSRRAYGTVTHPLAFTSALDVWDADDHNLFELALNSRTSGIALNPRTNHLFLAHALTYEPFPGMLNKRDNAIQILDTRSLGEVSWLDVPGGPGAMTVLGNTIYVAGREDGAITLIGDVPTQQPTAPTPTFTPTPYPSLTSTIKPAPTRAVTSSPSPTALPQQCVNQPDPWFLSKWSSSVAAKLGCPITPSESGDFAFQPFQSGLMYDDLRDLNSKQVYAFFLNHTYRRFPDTWNEGSPEDSCPEVSPQSGPTKPKRGFGKVWCEQGPVRSALGSAISEERGVSVGVQRFEHGEMWLTPSDTLVLFDEGGWQ
jgi:YVTN family beta-propeller protein